MRIIKTEMCIQRSCGKRRGKGPTAYVVREGFWGLVLFKLGYKHGIGIFQVDEDTQRAF